MRSTKWTSVVLVGAAALVLNPALACGGNGDSGSEEPETTEPAFQFSEADMRNEFAGEWTGTMTVGGVSETFTMTLAQADTGPEPAPATAFVTRGQLELQCDGGDSRSFVKEAAACAPVYLSTMPVSGSVTSGDGTFDATPVAGWFSIDGIVLDQAYGTLTLSLDTDGEWRIPYQAHTFMEGTTTNSAAGEGTVTLDAKL